MLSREMEKMCFHDFTDSDFSSKRFSSLNQGRIFITTNVADEWKKKEKS